MKDPWMIKTGIRATLTIAMGWVALTTPVGAATDQSIISVMSDPAYPRNICALPSPENPADKEHLAEWTNAKFGLFIHWGIYSVLEGGWKGERIPRINTEVFSHEKYKKSQKKKSVVFVPFCVSCGHSFSRQRFSIFNRRSNNG